MSTETLVANFLSHFDRYIYMPNFALVMLVNAD